ncbi:RNA polymerase sigma factor [Bryobacter aggregatus]|uniref:RNA polymerase sigma factor n=1 Tax=Bryobacter aggregatus TaxID=360054 RepID=UPI00138E2195|nr:RNA polymerase sigma factor [Bryobacter aggregatus]
MNAIAIDINPNFQPSLNEALLTRDDYAKAYQDGFNKTVRFLAANGASLELAEEVAQAAWVRGWERLSQLRHVAALTFWINSIAKNLLRSNFRKLQSSTELLETTLVETPLESESIDAHRMFAGCTETEKQLLKLYYVEGYTSQELSSTFGLSAVGVRVRLTRLKKNLVGRMNLEVSSTAAYAQEAA